MTVYVWALLIGALVAAAINYNSARAMVWILVGAFVFALTYSYFYVAPWWMPHAAVTGLADISFVILIDTFRKERWELWVQRCFMFSVVLSIAYLFGWIVKPIELGPISLSYGFMLEICNWAALLVMGGHGILRLADEGRMASSLPRPFALSRVHRLRLFLETSKRSKGVLARSAASWSG